MYNCATTTTTCHRLVFVIVSYSLFPFVYNFTVTTTTTCHVRTSVVIWLSKYWCMPWFSWLHSHVSGDCGLHHCFRVTQDIILERLFPYGSDDWTRMFLATVLKIIRTVFAIATFVWLSVLSMCVWLLMLMSSYQSLLDWTTGNTYLHWMIVSVFV